MTRTAKTYGGALYDLAQEEHLEDAILADLAGVRAVLDENPDYLRLLCTPSVPKEERRGLLDEAWRGNVHPYVLNFMKLLCDNGTLRELSGCAQEYRRRYNAAHDILEDAPSPPSRSGPSFWKGFVPSWRRRPASGSSFPPAWTSACSAACCWSCPTVSLTERSRIILRKSSEFFAIP